MAKITKTPGTALTALLEKHNLNYNRLAKAIGLSSAMVRLIARDENPVSAAVAFRLAKFFKTKPEYWLVLQMDFDNFKAAEDKKLAKALKDIPTVDKVSFERKPRTAKGKKTAAKGKAAAPKKTASKKAAAKKAAPKKAKAAVKKAVPKKTAAAVKKAAVPKKATAAPKKAAAPQKAAPKPPAPKPSAPKPPSAPSANVTVQPKAEVVQPASAPPAPPPAAPSEVKINEPQI
jgi:addiction module HigA family antidote